MRSIQPAGEETTRIVELKIGDGGPYTYLADSVELMPGWVTLTAARPYVGGWDDPIAEIAVPARRVVVIRPPRPAEIRDLGDDEGLAAAA